MSENGWWGDASPTSPLDAPLPALIAMSLAIALTSRFGFIMMRGKFCHSCFEITACTVLAQLGHFTLKTRVWFQKRRASTPSPPSGCATALTCNVSLYFRYEAGILFFLITHYQCIQTLESSLCQ